MRILIVLLVTIFIFLQYKLWVAKDGLAATYRLKHAIAKQTQIHDKLYKRNKLLAEQVTELKHNRAAVEAMAREEIGMIKKDETYYQIIQRQTKKMRRK